MKLPTTLEMKAALFGDGAKGYAIQVRRNEEYGITCTAVRESGAQPFVLTWAADALPNAEFKSLPELRIALEALE